MNGEYMMEDDLKKRTFKGETGVSSNANEVGLIIFNFYFQNVGSLLQNL